MSDEETEEPRCPVCGGPVATVTVVGPGEVFVAPCGQHVNSEIID